MDCVLFTKYICTMKSGKLHKIKNPHLVWPSLDSFSTGLVKKDDVVIFIGGPWVHQFNRVGCVLVLSKHGLGYINLAAIK
jgi:hypothetical protein